MLNANISYLHNNLSSLRLVLQCKIAAGINFFTQKPSVGVISICSLGYHGNCDTFFLLFLLLEYKHINMRVY